MADSDGRPALAVRAAGPIVSTFANEVGNTITITVAEQDGVGINNDSKKRVAFRGVCVTIEGPTSVAENSITLQEAEQLYAALGAFFQRAESVN